MANILHIGADIDLLIARTNVLRRYWSVTSVHYEHAIPTFQQMKYDLVLICYSVPEQRRKSLIAFLEDESPETPVLALTSHLKTDQIVRKSFGITPSSDPETLFTDIDKLLKQAS